MLNYNVIFCFWADCPAGTVGDEELQKLNEKPNTLSKELANKFGSNLAIILQHLKELGVRHFFSSFISQNLRESNKATHVQHFHKLANPPLLK